MIVDDLKSISAATITYFSDLAMIEELLKSVQTAASELFNVHRAGLNYFIVDNSDDETYFNRLDSRVSGVFNTDSLCVHIFRAKKNLGFGGGNNLILGQLHSRYHVIINPDVTLKRWSLSNAFEYLERNDGVAMITPRIDESKYARHVAKMYPDCFTLALRYIDLPFLNYAFKKRLKKYNCENIVADNVVEVEQVGGCFFFIRTALFKALDGFDDKYFMYFEDFDLSIRVRRLGSIVYHPDVVITHEGGGVGRKNIKHHIYFIRSAIRFYCCYGWKLF